jgi:hypothetical protein
VHKFLAQLKVLLYTIVVAGAVIAAILLATIAVPVIIGIGIVLAVYVTIRILNEEIDK